MMQRSILASGSPEDFSNVIGRFGVKKSNFVFRERGEASYDFLTREENGAFVSEVEGDFNYSIDFFLFDIDEEQLGLVLLDISLLKLKLAIPDEESQNPFDYILYDMGKAKKIQIIDDDNTEALYIRAPS